MASAEPDTMLTVMVEAQRLTNMTGQAYTIFTNDQPLYSVVVNITWVYPDRFQNFIPRLGGMHTLMNFEGAVGSLMAETGLENILHPAFSGVPKKHAGIITQVLPAHVLSRCETVAYLWGIGKGTVVKILKNGYQLRTLGNLNAEITDVIT